MAFTEHAAREASDRMARILGEGWAAATVTARTVDADVHYPAATCGGVRVVQTSDRPVTYRAEVQFYNPGSDPVDAASGLLLRLERAVRALRRSEVV